VEALSVVQVMTAVVEVMDDAATAEITGATSGAATTRVTVEVVGEL
jgi:hypothetical protein